MPGKWKASHMPSQRGKVAIVTGGNSGIGYSTALELARHGAFVVIACRNDKRGRQAAHQIMNELAMDTNTGRVEYRYLDVSNLESVKTFVEGFKKAHDRLDLLINNAGVLGETYDTSVDGYELQFATNYLGHFALTAQLLGLLRESTRARVVVLSSMAYNRAVFDKQAIVSGPDDYDEMTTYGKTKLYNMLFMMELNRQLQAHGINHVIATGAHPGFCATNIAQSRVDKAGWFQKQIMDILKASPMVQTPAMGALPTLYAATAEDVQPGDYFGPRGLFAIAGHPTREPRSANCESVDDAKTLWEVSETMAHVKFEW